MSQSALSGILREVSRLWAEGVSIPSAQRHDIRRSRDSSSLRQTSYGLLHQSIPHSTLDGGTVTIEYQHPLAMLQTCVSDSPEFADMLLHAYNVQKPTLVRPWRLIVYGDEIVPGNVLAHDQQRKSWCIYWSIAEFGHAVLCDELAWFLATAFCHARMYYVSHDP